MKFDDKYPNTLPNVQPYPGILKSAGNPRPCWHCKEPTNWWDIAYGAPLCSEECVTAKDKEAEKVCKETAP